MSQKSYAAFVYVLQSGVTAGLTAIWVAQNQSTSKAAYLRNISLAASFNGTGAATSMVYNLSRATGTPTGGNVGGPVKENLNDPNIASVMTNIRYGESGITGGTFGGTTCFAILACPRTAGASTYLTLEWGSQNDPEARFMVPPGESVCIYLGLPSVAGDLVSGTVRWWEA